MAAVLFICVLGQPLVLAHLKTPSLRCGASCTFKRFILSLQRHGRNRDARRLVLCGARYVFLQRTFKLWEARVGALGGARATITRNDALARAVRFTGFPVFRTWPPLKRGGVGCMSGGEVDAANNSKHY